MIVVSWKLDIVTALMWSFECVGYKRESMTFPGDQMGVRYSWIVYDGQRVSLLSVKAPCEIVHSHDIYSRPNANNLFTRENRHLAKISPMSREKCLEKDLINWIWRKEQNERNSDNKASGCIAVRKCKEMVDKTKHCGLFNLKSVCKCVILPPKCWEYVAALFLDTV